MTQRTVLIAEDESHLLQAMSGRLREAGYGVVTARDGREALELAHAEHPDLVVADYQMPRLSGLELCRRLRQADDTRDIPAIVLAAHGYSVHPRDIESSGIRLLAKPLTPRQLVAAVDEALRL